MPENPLYPESDSFSDRWGSLPVETPRFNLTPNSSLIESEPKQLKSGIDPVSGRPDLKFVPVQGDPWKRHENEPLSYGTAAKYIGNRLLGTNGEERYQTIPERIIRGIPGAIGRGLT